MFNMTTILQALIIGISVGSIYALVALGYTMVYGIIRLINFAHGDFIMVGGYAMFFIMPTLRALGLSWGMVVLIALIASIAICAFVGVAVELVAYRPIRKKGTGMSALITAIAMSLLLENLGQVFFKSNKQTFKEDFFTFKPINIGSISIGATTIMTIVISVVLMIGLSLLVNKSKFGRAMRAVSEDKEAAVISGVNVNRTILSTFAIGSALAAFAAMSYCDTVNYVYPTIGATLGLKAFVAAVLGGIGSLPGAMLGGLVIGIVESLVKSFPVVSNYSDAVVYLVLILVLLVKPAGILGKKVSEKV